MAEMLTYAPDLRSITGGQGDYTLEFLRYEEVPDHLAQKVVEQATERARGHATRERDRDAPCARSGYPRLMATRSIVTSQPDVDVRRVRAAAAARRAAGGVPRRPASVGWCASCARRAPRTRAGCARPSEHPVSAAPLRPRRGRGLFGRLRSGGQARAAPRPQARRASGRADDARGARLRRRSTTRRRGAALAPAPEPAAAGPRARRARRGEPRPSACRRARCRRRRRRSAAERAIEVFNAGEHPARVAGVARSLGAPA